MWVEESSSDFSLLAGENVEELFTRIAIMAFENIMMKEVKSASLPSNGQIATTSTLISKLKNIVHSLQFTLTTVLLILIPRPHLVHMWGESED